MVGRQVTKERPQRPARAQADGVETGDGSSADPVDDARASAAETAAAVAAAREMLQVVIVGHVDHGKSTLVGRLLCDTGTIPQSKVDAVRELCARQGKRFEHAFLLDALEAERAQGITIDSARCFFGSERRDYILVDAPGHVEFIRNMVSGAARTEAALLLLDAHEGIRENSRRHGKLLSLLGIRQVVVVVNKLDLIDYDAVRYGRLIEAYGAFLGECGITPICYVPVSAREGDNVVTPSPALAWYDGPTLLEALDGLQRLPRPVEAPLRMPVQDVYKFNEKGNDERLVVGRLVSGRLRVGEDVIFSPSGKRGRVKALRSFPGPSLESVSAGENASVVLEDELYVPRGEVLHHADDPPLASRLISTRLFWLGRQPLRAGGRYGLRLATAEMEAEVVSIPSTTDAATLQTLHGASQVERNQIAEVVLRCRHRVALDIDGGAPDTQRFVLLDGYDLAGGGLILGVDADDAGQRTALTYLENFAWRPQAVAIDAWRERLGHSALCVLLVGDGQTRNAEVAAATQRLLFEAGVHAALLDSANVLADAPRDTSLESAHERLAASFVEALTPLLGAGLVTISTSAALGQADHGWLRERLDSAVFTVLLSPDRNARLVDADVQFFGRRGTEAIAQDVATAVIQRIRQASAADPA